MRRLCAGWIIGLSLCSSGCAVLCEGTALLAYKAREQVNDFFERRRNLHTQ